MAPVGSHSSLVTELWDNEHIQLSVISEIFLCNIFTQISVGCDTTSLQRLETTSVVGQTREMWWLAYRLWASTDPRCWYYSNERRSGPLLCHSLFKCGPSKQWSEIKRSIGHKQETPHVTRTEVSIKVSSWCKAFWSEIREEALKLCKTSARTSTCW